MAGLDSRQNGPDDGVPGVDRPWRKGDQVRVLLPGGAQFIGECSTLMADELNGIKPPGAEVAVRFLPEAFFSDPEFRDIFDLLTEAGGELHIEQLEHRWEQRRHERGQDER